ncbi:MAG: class B sortase [Acetatifactor sp.]|nr:class B sortase [Acetatifactor sp.]
MTQKTYVVEGRQFRTQSDYARASRDKELIDKLRQRVKGNDPVALKQLSQELHSGQHKFYTLLGQDFQDEIDDLVKKAPASQTGKGVSGKKLSGQETGSKVSGKAAKTPVAANVPVSTEMDKYVEDALKQREKRRKQLILLCSLVSLACLGYFSVYSYFDYRTRSTYERWSEIRENAAENPQVTYTPVIHYDDPDREIPEVLDEYKNLLNKNQKLIGWLKIDDTKIDYPVMQTNNNEYYLDHNLNQEYDKNGSIFMDKDCDVLKPSTNYILYGHHMQSGRMFGDLDKYASQKYAEEHPYIEFDTIYEHGLYQVMYVFRSRVYSEEEIVFKYYQFIDAASEQEFDSNMQEMAAISLYDTGVTARYGDQLLTLSTCDYQETNGRFVVVAKRVTAKE